MCNKLLNPSAAAAKQHFHLRFLQPFHAAAYVTHVYALRTPPAAGANLPSSHMASSMSRHQSLRVSLSAATSLRGPALAPSSSLRKLFLGESALVRAVWALRVLRYACIAVGCVGIGCAVAAANYVFADRVADPFANPLGVSPVANDLKLASSVLTAVLLALVCAKSWTLFSIRKLRGHTLPQQRYIDTVLWRPLLLEIIVCAIHCPVGVYALVDTQNPVDVTITYDLDSLLAVCMFARLSFVFLLLLHELVRLDSGERSSAFVLRCLLEQRPILTSAIVFIFSTVLFAYAVRVAEEPVCFTPETLALGWCVGYKSLQNYANCAWLIIVAALTIGFGDLVPYTTMGRCVVTIASIIGVVNIAVLVNSVRRAVEFSDIEVRHIHNIALRRLAVQRKTLAARVVASFMVFSHERTCIGGHGSGKGGSVGAGENSVVRSHRVINTNADISSVDVSAARSAPHLGDGRGGSALSALASASSREACLPRCIIAPGIPGASSVRRLARAIRIWAELRASWAAAKHAKKLEEEEVDSTRELQVTMQRLLASLTSLQASAGRCACATDGCPRRDGSSGTARDTGTLTAVGQQPVGGGNCPRGAGDQDSGRTSKSRRQSLDHPRPVGFAS